MTGHTHTPSLISAREPRACGRSPRSSRPPGKTTLVSSQERDRETPENVGFPHIGTGRRDAPCQTFTLPGPFAYFVAGISSTWWRLRTYTARHSWRDPRCLLGNPIFFLVSLCNLFVWFRSLFSFIMNVTDYFSKAWFCVVLRSYILSETFNMNTSTRARIGRCLQMTFFSH